MTALVAGPDDQRVSRREKVDAINPTLNETSLGQQELQPGLSRLTCRKGVSFRDLSTPILARYASGETVTGWLCKENYGGQEESSEEGCKEGEEGKEEDEEVASALLACLNLHESCMKRSRESRPLLLCRRRLSPVEHSAVASSSRLTFPKPTALPSFGSDGEAVGLGNGTLQ